ncbi:ATP synthase subunit H-domain-containing protein [Baffinella frigidus]|nr:ATP synthase subunit H-domain-containing protein [Cryptophyta sp. CCMP2293]
MVAVSAVQQLVLLLALLPVVAAMTPQWRGLVNGSVIYIAFGVFGLFFVVCISKPNKPLFITSVVITTVCTWLLWACCYMSQMYPLLTEAPHAPAHEAATEH